MRKVSGRLRLDLAQYREMKAFAQFGSDLDKATQDKLAQGERLMEILKQPQFSPYTTAQEAAILFVSINGYLMDIPVNKIGVFVKGFLEYLETHDAGLMESVAKTGVLSSENEQELVSAVENFKQLKQ
jgi:F-type H+-transporting ATPase subunit alpha